MAMSAAISFSLSSPTTLNLHRYNHLNFLPPRISLTTTTSNPSLSLSSSNVRHHICRKNSFTAFSLSSGDGGNNNNNNNNNSGGGGGNGGGNGDDGDEDEDEEEDKNRKEAMLVLGEVGRSLDSLPKDLAAAIDEGKISAEIVKRFLNLEMLGFIKWLLQFGGFRERLLADDLFLAKLGMECGVGMFTKTLAEYQRRKETFFDELEVVFADVAMAVIADFMLVYLPAPTISFRQPLGLSAGPIAKFFHSCPDNAFQIALGGASYSLMQRFGAIMRNGAKLFAVGTTSSLVGTAVTNAVINARKSVDKSGAEEVENIPIVSTSVAYGVYMAISSNLRYQLLSGVIEQRILEPMFHNQKLILSALCFAARTGNTFCGSLLWVDYARLIGIQKEHKEEHA